MANTMPKPRAHILLLLTGGTITMTKDEQGILKPAHDVHEIISTFPKMQEIAEIEVLEVCDIDSSNMAPGIWQDLANHVCINYAQYDGFVITHGTDTLPYTATALSFALQNLNKPVILTGAQKPISELGSDSPFNIFNSFQVAAKGKIREVAIVFDTKIMRGNRTSKRHAKKIDAFWSPQFPLLGEIGMDIRYFSFADHPLPAKPLELVNSFDSQILSLDLFPGFDPQILYKLLETKNYHGVILRGFGIGNIPTNTNLLAWIAQATAAQIPVILISPCPGGTTYLDLYETGTKPLKAGAISAWDMTLEAATVKLMWILGQTKNMVKIKELWQTNIAGELNIS